MEKVGVRAGLGLVGAISDARGLRQLMRAAMEDRGKLGGSARESFYFQTWDGNSCPSDVSLESGGVGLLQWNIRKRRTAEGWADFQSSRGRLSDLDA